jgi:adenosylhomocysteine nucleosidase
MASEAHLAGATFAESLLADGTDPVQVVDTALQRHRSTVIAFVGMNFEAKIAAGPGVRVFSRNSRRELAIAARNAARQGYRGIISFGVAGGLVRGLGPGDWVIASAIVEAGTARSTDTVWSNRLRDAIGEASHAPIIGVDTPVAEPATKRELHRATGAAAVDMESHVVARLAEAHGLAFTALRVIVDPADRAIPPAALMGMGPDARADGAAVLRDLFARPSQLSLLLRVSMDAFIARSEMLRVRRLLGPHFALTDVSWQDVEQPIAPEDDLVARSAVAPYRAPA